MREEIREVIDHGIDTHRLKITDFQSQLHISKFSRKHDVNSGHSIDKRYIENARLLLCLEYVRNNSLAA